MFCSPGEFIPPAVLAPIYLTAAELATLPAENNRGRTVYVTDLANARKVSRSTGFDTWAWLDEPNSVYGATGQTVGAATVVLTSGTVPEGTSLTLLALVAADRGGGVETASIQEFAGVRRVLGGNAVLVPGSPLEVAGVRDSALPAPAWTAVFAVNGGNWELIATGAAGLTINWSADVQIRRAP